jgi:CRP-like cAMP-binding protein
MCNINIISTLQNAYLFRSLPLEPLEKIAARAKCRQFFAGETIELEGNPSNSIYVIANGIVAVKKLVNKQKEHIFAYLMHGQSFGEVGILENRPRSATVSAVSEVDVIVIQRNDFLDILHRYSVVAIELARTLGRYLTETNHRLSRSKTAAKLILLINLTSGSGGTNLCSLLCKSLVKRNKNTTVYLEYPTPYHIAADLNIKIKDTKYTHSDGYDIMLAVEDNNLPDVARTTVVLDNLTNTYHNVVVSVYGSEISESIKMMLDYANLVIVLAPPLPELADSVKSICRQIRTHIRSDETALITIVNYAKKEYKSYPSFPFADIVIPYLDNIQPLYLSQKEGYTIPDQLSEVVNTLIDRLERVHQIGVFIPTTIQTNQTADTTAYVQRTLSFFAERFGGATSRQADGVWNSVEEGLIGERVYFVFSYVTQEALSLHIDEVIEYVKVLKKELTQEAMAIEIDDKLTLI